MAAPLIRLVVLGFILGTVVPSPAAAAVVRLPTSHDTVTSVVPARGAAPAYARSYFGARYYRADVGRFTTIDPLMTIEENLVDPQRWNRYAYALNSPLRYTDPDGRPPLVLAGYGVYVVVATAAVATTAWLVSPPGQQAVRDVASDTGAMITTAVGAIRSWFQADNSRGEPPQLKEGKEAHKNEEVRPGEKAEVPTPSGKGRMDRYDADKAHIREIKPDNARGERGGQKQLDRYRKEMEDATGRPHTTELTKWRKEY